MSSPATGNPLNDCGCCEGNTVATPARIENRAGLSTVSYRAGDYHSFNDSMLSLLSSSKLPKLEGLSTRDSDDYSIALIDAWACVSDVLCFYQEYFANEGLLRTAKERLSVLEHARLIGYQLNPGVAASTFLAFTMDEPAAGMDNPVTETKILAGSKVQSTPGPDETAQMFETDSDIQARVDWNALRPRMTQPQGIKPGMGSVVINGITTFVKPGDDLLIVREDVGYPEKVSKVISNNDTQTTRLKLLNDDDSAESFTLPLLPEGSYDDFSGVNEIDDHVLEKIIDHAWNIDDLVAIADARHWDLGDLMEQINAKSDRNNATSSDDASVHGFRKRANLFGYNAQKRVDYNTKSGLPDNIADWEEWERGTDEECDALYLDNAYGEVVKDSYLMLHSPASIEEAAHEPIPASTEVFKASDVSVIARTAYGISSRTTKVNLSRLLYLKDDLELLPGWDYPMHMLTLIRQSEVKIQSETLDLTQVPISDPVEGDRILLNGADLFLRKQQYVVVNGNATNQSELPHSEVLQIKQVRLENGFTQLIFATSLQHQYERNSLTINANVAPASHGESVSEILGSGDAGIASQKFELKQPPLTYTSADVPGGAASSLNIRVNDVLWHEVDTFLGRGSDENIYTTKLTDEGTTQIYFGNGIEGARLPSGNNNVIARYRKGIGLGGLVKAKQLNLLLTQPLGVKAAVNPVESSGADEPEILDDARSNAPLGLLTLGRAVSLSDYEDFSGAFAGVSKAKAVARSVQGVPGIYITIAGPEGTILERQSKTYKNLLSALQSSGDPYTHFSVLSYRPAYFKIDAGLYVHADYKSDLVLEEARLAMRNAFSFKVRSLNKPVHLSEIIGVLQQVDGVLAVDINSLYRSDSAPVTPLPRSIMPTLISSGSRAMGVELISLDPAPLDQLRVKS